MAIPVRISDDGGNYRYPPSRPRRNNTILVIIFIIIALFMSGIPMKLYNDITVYRHEKIKNYLDQREQYFSSSDIQFKQVLNKVYQLKGTNITQAIPDIQQAKILILNNYQSTSKLKPPRAFQDLHEETLQWYIQKNAAIDYLEKAALSNSYNSNTLNIYINEINRTLSNIQPKFIQGLQKEKLEYKINTDGSLVYWYKTYYEKY